MPQCAHFFQIAHSTIRKLSDVKGISEAKVLKLKEIVKAMVPMDFKTAADALEDRKYVLVLMKVFVPVALFPYNLRI